MNRSKLCEQYKNCCGGKYTVSSIVICDDNSIFTDYFANMLAKILKSKNIQSDILTAKNASELSKLISETDKLIDVIFMDIDFGADNGITLTRELNKLLPNTVFVYVTAYIEYAEKIYKSKFSNFIVKPITEEKIEYALNNVFSEIQKRQSRTIKICSSGNFISVNIDDIIYAESNKRKIVVHTSAGSEEFYFKISEFEEKLGKGFYRCHKSFIINFCHIKRLLRDFVILDNGVEIPIAQKKQPKIKNAYIDFISTIGGEINA